MGGQLTLAEDGAYDDLISKRQYQIEEGALHAEESLEYPKELFAHYDGVTVKEMPASWGESVTIMRVRVAGMKQGASQLRVPGPHPNPLQIPNAGRNALLHLPIGYVVGTDHCQLSLQLYHRLSHLLRRTRIQLTNVEMPLEPAYAGDWSAWGALTGTGGASAKHLFPGMHYRSTKDGAVEVTWHSNDTHTAQAKLVAGDQPAETAESATPHDREDGSVLTLHWTQGRLHSLFVVCCCVLMVGSRPLGAMRLFRAGH